MKEKDELLTMFIYAVDNNLFDLMRGLYPDLVEQYSDDTEILKYADEAVALMNIRLYNMRRER